MYRVWSKYETNTADSETLVGADTRRFSMSTISQQVTPPQDPHANDVLLTIAEVADVVRVPVATLRYWRHLGTGPHSFRIGRGVRYWRSEVSAWLHGQSNGTTAA
jgi:predicted DNA-binding transcriptional regulator AlpA